MREKLFGTDGLRGRVNEYPMVPEIALRLGLAVGQKFRNGGSRHKVIIGKDTRLSGYVFETALTSGFCAMGMEVFLVGPMPTPAISFLTRNMRADLGVVISASHNPFSDNGIKFFDHEGFKLPDDLENEIAELTLAENPVLDFPAPERVGRAKRMVDSWGRYLVYLKNTFPREMNLNGMKIVLDCAHGAAYAGAPKVFEELGAEVVSLGVSPNGVNINEGCGSLHPEVVSQKVREVGADIGLALDGDADRLIVVDEQGKVLDGDQIMALCAQDMMERDRLTGGMLVATVMSNMALEMFMKSQGGKLLRTPVGDRYVVEAMRREGAVLGGEQSGHLIFMEHSTTGDGTLAALQLLRIMCQKNLPLSLLAHLIEPLPQIMVNVRVEKKIPFCDLPDVGRAVALVEAEMRGRGRVLLRYSGTEHKARVMVEGEDRCKVEQYAQDIAELLGRCLRT
ncbi:MAG: phosphoglucosamine mutase [Desulfovibrionaceae bacterium CG1_02_65_16]|nr:MAG: phosphoglucosamine mutase [Desulfovibrionaceae bacterium CG1_02_65_16]